MGMDDTDQESPRLRNAHPMTRMPKLPRSDVFALGAPELLYGKTTPDSDLHATVALLESLAAMRIDRSDFHVGSDAIAEHRTRAGRRLLERTTVRVRGPQLEVVAYADNVATHRIRIPWSLPRPHLPLGRQAAMRLVVHHARAAARLLMHAVGHPVSIGTNVYRSIAETASIIVACTSPIEDKGNLRLPSPWMVPALVPNGGNPIVGDVSIGVPGVVLANLLLPRTHVVWTDTTGLVDNLLPEAVVLSPISIDVSPMGAMEAMRRLPELIAHGGRPMGESDRAALLAMLGRPA